MKQTLFITGTDTGVGKTVLTALLAHFCAHAASTRRRSNPSAPAAATTRARFSPRMDGAFTLDEINPWHFRAPIAPSLAARRENKSVKLAQVLAHIARDAKAF